MATPVQNLREKITQDLGADLLDSQIEVNQLTITVPRAAIVKIMSFLRDGEGLDFHQLIDLCGVDHVGRRPRFDVVYNLLSMTKNHRLRVKVQVDEDTPIPSIVSIFKAANWLERETWDMYGLKFDGHPDLRRLLTDYEFEGFPLRKDFPLTGHVEVRYDHAAKKVQYEPVNLQQEYRRFDFESPWEAMTTAAQRTAPILPGDEKAETKQVAADGVVKKVGTGS